MLIFVNVNEAKQCSSSSGKRDRFKDALQDILLYPRPTITKRKRKVNNLPSVLTLQKWVNVAKTKKNKVLIK